MASSSLPSLQGLKLAVAGAGVFGLGAAVLASAAGARVTLFDPCALGDNASGVAAGMVSPGLEAALDGAGEGALLEGAYDAWPRFAESLGLSPPPEHAAGALYLAPAPALDALALRLEALGLERPERLAAGAARALQPALAPDAGEALLVRRDGRVDPHRLLAALAARLRYLGGEIASTTLTGAALSGFDATVLATGYEARRWIDLAPEVAALQPIKGHVLHFQGGPSGGPTLRGEDGYAAPQRKGVVFGATMEPGARDLRLDPAAVAGLHHAARRLLPELAEATFEARTGVRAATPDGLPLVGRSVGGLHLAVGARRNGWLLAPLVAPLIVASLAGEAPFAPLAPDRSF